MGKKLAAFIQNFAIYFGIVFAVALTLLTFLLTTKIAACTNENMEVTFAPYIVIAVLLFVIIISIKPIFSRFKKINPETIARIAFLWGLVMSVLWIFIANVLPMWDSQDLVYAAEALNMTPEPLSMGKWAPGSYMERYPYQVPIALLLVICMKIAGSNYVIFFELLNCVACAFTMYFTIKYTHLIFKNKTATTVSAILVMLFAPLILYSTFVYGNLLCLPFGLGCLILQKKALDAETTKRRVLLIIASIIMGAIAVLFKSPMLIVALAAAVVYLVWGLQNKKPAYIIVAIVSVLVAKYAISPINAYVEMRTGTNLHNGTPMTTWITMGIGGGNEYFADTTGDEAQRTNTYNAGYYNGYPWISPGEDDTYSPEAFQKTNLEYIKKRIAHYISDPGLFFAFFGNKLAVEWTEPTFEGLLASNWTNPSDPRGYDMCSRQLTRLAGTVYYGKVHTVLIFVLDALQTVIPLGVLAALIGLRKKLDILQMGSFIAVLGMFVVYLFWENKTQYMFPAFLFMIPLSAMGWVIVAQKIQKLSIYKKVAKKWKRH